MAAKKPAPQAASKASGKTINRNRRNSLERKSLSKNMKRLFKSADHGMFKTILEAEKHSRKKSVRQSALTGD